MSCVIHGYDKFLEYEELGTGQIVYADIGLNFKHKALKTLDDLIEMVDEKNKYKNGIAILDELWKRADNRKCMGLLTEFTDAVLLSSRKARLDIVYTQQYMQIDPRIAFITTEWIEPKVYPEDAGIEYGIKPELLILNRLDGELEPLTPIPIECEPYLELYDTEKNPYFVQDQLNPENLKRMIRKIKEKQGMLEE